MRHIKKYQGKTFIFICSRFNASIVSKLITAYKILANIILDG